jgi:arylsulfatase
MGPFERAEITSNAYWDWFLSKSYLALAGSAIATEFVKTFKEFPPRQKPGSFTIDDALAAMAAAETGGKGAVAKTATAEA